MARTPSPDDDAVVLYSSLRGIAAAYFSPTFLTAVGVWGASQVGARVVPVLFLVAGVGLGLVTAFDYPRHTVFSARGIDRVALLRTERLAWDRIDSLGRGRGSLVPRPANYTGGSDRAGRLAVRPSAGGLVALRGRRRYLLVDQPESVEEYAALQALLERHHVEVGLGALPPPSGTPPTWLHRRRERARRV